MGYEYKKRIFRKEKKLRILKYIDSMSVDGSAQIQKKDLLEGTALTRGQFEDVIPDLKQDGYLVAINQFDERLGVRIATRYSVTEKGKKFLEDAE